MTSPQEESSADVAMSTACCQYRWVTAGMGVWMAVISYMLSSNMSVAIVCMAKLPSPPSFQINDSMYHTDDGINNATNTHRIVSKDSAQPSGNTFINLSNTSNLLSDYYIANTDNEINGRYPFHNQNSGTVKKSDVDDRTLNLVETNRECEATSKNDSSYQEEAEFTWDKVTQSYVLSGFYYGYTIGQIPFGWLAGRYGSRHVVGTCITIVSIITLVTPILAKTNVFLVVVARVLLGLISGAFSPGWYMLMGVWALPNERSRFSAAFWFGQILGIILGYTTSGLLCVHGFGNKWTSIFYVQGIVGTMFAISWWLLVYDSPRQHPRISTEEVNLIEHHVKRKAQGRVPWCKIMSYIPCWALFITHFCDNFIYYLCITCLPLYMKEILKFDIQSNGFFSSLPFLVMMTATIPAGLMADFIRSKKWLKITNIRKIFQTVGLLGVAIFIIIPGYLTCNMRAVVIACLCSCAFFQSIGNVGGHTSVSVDMAPRFASVIFAVSNSIASLPGILAPLAVAELTQNQTSTEWRVVFYIAAGVAVFAIVVFVVFSSSDRAPWADEGTIRDCTIITKSVSYRNRPMNDTVSIKPLIQQDNVNSKQTR